MTRNMRIKPHRTLRGRVVLGQLLLGVLLGAAIAVGAALKGVLPLPMTAVGEEGAATSGERQPLYWVAPMDPNYRRDKPGKSPMGMDLVPVYEEPKADTDAGSVAISPTVVQNLGVRVEALEKRTLSPTLTSVGTVSFDEERLVHIHPRLEGWLDKLYLKVEGQRVKKGQPMYELYSPALVSAQEELLIALERQNPRLTEAARARLRALQVPEASIRQIEQQRKILQRVTFTAPQSGIVVNLGVREGFYVVPGTSLFSIAALDQVWVEGEVPEQQAALLKVGQQATMLLDAFPGKVWNGRLDYIYPVLDARFRVVKVRMRFPNADGELKPNMFADVRIQTESAKPVLALPREALIRTGKMDRVVVALDTNTFKSVEVSVGRSDARYFEVLSGLSEGDSVVASGQFLLDSESSRESDFKRLSANESDKQGNSVAAEAASVWVAAKVDEVMADSSELMLTHEAIPEWKMMGMTMLFKLAPEVDLSTLKAGMSVHVQMQKDPEHYFLVTRVHVPDPAGM